MKRYLYLAICMLPLVSCRGFLGDGPDMPGSETGTPTLKEMYEDIGRPAKLYKTPDDWEFLTILICNDLEGADAFIRDSHYNWFDICGDYSSRNVRYRNPKLRYTVPYNMIASANALINRLNNGSLDDDALIQIAQARALRAWSYLLLAPSYQFNYQLDKDLRCVPIVSEERCDETNNPRASVGDVYNQILEDLNFAVSTLEGVSRSSKMMIDGHVAHGLRARALLDMGRWDQAYSDAEEAAEGYTPATLEEVSRPAFYDISEHNWIWGYDMNAELAGVFPYATTSSWLRSFSAMSYATNTQCYCCINKLLYDKIPAGDIRKQWWVDEHLNSTLLDGLQWPGFNDVAHADDGEEKLPYLPYTNVKFGCYSIGTHTNDEDMPLMRVEEMILIMAECKARTGNDKAARTLLENFVNTYRMASGTYSAAEAGRSLLDEIWFQRRVELWGEGFGILDTKRQNKPLVRFHDDTGNMPAAFRFNLSQDDEWLLMRFPEDAMRANRDLVDNTGGLLPQTDDSPYLRDGVTD